MNERLGPLRRVGLRGRLAAYFAAIVLVAIAVLFFAVYRGTGSLLRDRIDSDLAQEVAAAKDRLAAAGDSPAALTAAARDYVSNQPFLPSARILIVSISGGPTITNEPELLRVRGVREPESPAELRAELAQAQALSSAPAGYSDVEVAEVGDVRLLTEPLVQGGQVTATVRAGEPLAPVESAQHDVARTFLLWGGIAALAAIAAGIVLAARIAAPLRRMSRIAARVDAGDLSPRIEPDGPADEIHALGASFDRMLDRLEDAFALQRAFVSDASHELRTPLTVIRGQIEVLARQPTTSPEDLRRVEHVVSAEVERMEHLVDDLLSLARMDERGARAFEEFDVGAWFAQATDLGELARERRLEVAAPPQGRMRGDPAALTQVVRNLVRNSVEHTEANGVIQISGEASRDRLSVTVDDDGTGIPSSERERVFERFHRGEATRRTGSGLGLSIARAIVESHGGRIYAEASELGGARIGFYVRGLEPASA